MANNKVQLRDGTVLLDLTGDTVTPETLAAGVTAAEDVVYFEKKLSAVV